MADLLTALEKYGTKQKLIFRRVKNTCNRDIECPLLLTNPSVELAAGSVLSH